jgi:hypothetical protein
MFELWPQRSTAPAALRSTIASPVTESYRQWRGGVGSCFHGRLEGYAGHLVQVTNDFGELVAVAGRCRSTRSRNLADRSQDMRIPRSSAT